MSSSDTLPSAEIDAILSSHLARRRDQIGSTATAAAIQAAAGTLDRTLYRGAFGRVDLESSDAEAVTPTTPFDIASVTKSLVGSVLAMQAVDEGLLRWDIPIAEIFPPWRQRSDPESQKMTFLQVLNHTSGLPAWHKYYLEHPLDPSPELADKTRAEVLQKIIDTPLEAAPGTVHAYSDLGYLLLGRLLELAFGESLYDLAHTRIFEPLELARTRYIDCRSGPKRIPEAVVTEDCSLRERLVRGTVHDENTNIIGGVSTHAGVFSTADDLLTFGRHLLAIDGGEAVENPLISRSTLQFAWSKQAGSTMGHHLAGWDTPSGPKSSAGSGFSRDNTVGHLGFTGTSIWIERERGVVSVLLSNRVYPTRDNDRIRDLRIAFQEAILPPH